MKLVMEQTWNSYKLQMDSCHDPFSTLNANKSELMSHYLFTFSIRCSPCTKIYFYICNNCFRHLQLILRPYRLDSSYFISDSLNVQLPSSKPQFGMGLGLWLRNVRFVRPCSCLEENPRLQYNAIVGFIITFIYN